MKRESHTQTMKVPETISHELADFNSLNKMQMALNLMMKTRSEKLNSEPLLFVKKEALKIWKCMII